MTHKEGISWTIPNDCRSRLTTGAMRVALGVGFGLVIGKPLGIVVVSWLAVRLGIASLPQGVTWSGILVVGCVAGIGFTMSLFIGALAFQDPTTLAIAKISVLAASLVSGSIGLAVGYKLLARHQSPVPKTTSAGEAA